ncbi:MAG: hypothetical protein AB7U73_01300 [Pirellulales bacterium]
MVAAYPAVKNVFIPSHEASGSMVVDFSRNVGDFAINQYAQIVPTKNNRIAGAFLKMTIEQAGRIVNADLSDFHWPDGAAAPEGNDELESHEFAPFVCKRYTYPFRIGDLTIQNASWDIVAKHARIAAQRAMTARTVKLLSILTNASNWGTHTSTVNSITGTGNFSAATSSNLNIKKTVDYVCDLILKDTLSAIALNDLRMVISPGAARKMAETQEIVDLIKQSPQGIQYIRNELEGGTTYFGLPNNIYGLPLIMEKTVRVTTRKGATTSKSYVLGDTNVLITSRPGGLVGTDEAPSFSTACVFMQEEMTVEQKNDTDNRRTTGRVVECFDPQLVAPVSGYLLTSATT